ncbi:MAG: ABC transporter ATP-binding protein [Nanoarchaeota archaeon]|nr:ABC transporter ATP-binding protein [Nanoarchaeota archaeon]
MLKLSNLKKSFGGVKAVNNCTFHVDKGKITALIGPNGSGKTTLFNLVFGVLKADSGKIIFDKNELTNLSIQKISNLGISRIFQQSRLFDNLTIKENMLLAFDNEDTKLFKSIFGLNKTTKEKEDKIEETLKLVNMDEHKNKLAKNISYGQKRLIEIARSIIKPHKMLMLDEPVTGVTPSLRKTLTKLLSKLRDEGETIFIIEHNMNFVLNIADEVIVLDEGKVIASGKPDIIKKNKLVLEAYLGD